MSDILSDLATELPDEISARADALALIQRTLARAAVFAPCILDPDFAFAEAARAVLLDVIERRVRVATMVPGVSTTKSRGDRTLSIDASGVPLVMFQPDEITELQRLCAQAAGGPVAAGVTEPIGSFPDARPWPC